MATRAVLLGAVVGGVAACSAILGIQDPVPRDDDAGGIAGASGALSGGNAGASAGSAGVSGSSGASGSASGGVNSTGGSAGAGVAGTAGKGAGGSAGGTSAGGTSGAGGKSGASGAGAGGKSGASGAGASGTAGAAGNGGATCSVSDPPDDDATNPYVQPNGYFTTNELHGYAFTSVDSLGSTIAPQSCSTTIGSYDSLPAGSAFCAKGTLVSGGYALIGITLNQTAAGLSAPLAPPTGTGLVLTVTDSTTLASEILLIKLTDKNEVSYCAALPTSGVLTAAWSSFNTGTCNGNATGTAFSPNLGLNTVQVVAEGVSTTTSYD
ncbi:MAG TPA: hypothetical protein VGM29_15665, partial [Polyangiaceae bacterium]